MERKSETTRNFTRVNNLTLISLSRSLMKHVLSNSHSEKLPEKSRPRSIPSLIKRDILRRKRCMIWSVTWSSFGLWTVIRYSASILKQTNTKRNSNKNGNSAQDIPIDGTSCLLFPGRIGMLVFSLNVLNTVF